MVGLETGCSLHSYVNVPRGHFKHANKCTPAFPAHASSSPDAKNNREMPGKMYVEMYNQVNVGALWNIAVIFLFVDAANRSVLLRVLRDLKKEKKIDVFGMCLY